MIAASAVICHVGKEIIKMRKEPNKIKCKVLRNISSGIENISRQEMAIPAAATK